MSTRRAPRMLARGRASRASRASGAQAGFSLVEILVVTTLMALLTALIAAAWRPIGQASARLRDEASGLTELRLAVEALRFDLGAAEALEPNGDHGLRIRRERFGRLPGGRLLARQDGAETEYRLVDGDLLRRDAESDTTYAVAHGLNRFESRRDGDGLIRIRLAVLDGSAEQEIELVWVP